MKRMVKIGMSVGSPFVLAILFFFFFVLPARAPSGGKQWTGGRTIASLQEEDFDRRLLKLQLCYGVRLTAEQCTLERRRVCKAMLVHEVETSFETSGLAPETPLYFRCEDTALGHSGEDQDEVALRPNSEITAIRGALGPARSNATTANSSSYARAKAEAVCEYITDCKWAMRPQSLSLRKLASCLTTSNAMHRKVLLSEVASLVFGSRPTGGRALYSTLVEAAGK